MRLWCVVATKTDGLCASRDFLSAELVACLDMSLLCADVEPTLVSKEPLFANVAAFHLDRRSKAFHVQASAAESGVEIIDEISDIRSALHMQSDQQRSTLMNTSITRDQTIVPPWRAAHPEIRH